MEIIITPSEQGVAMIPKKNLTGVTFDSELERCYFPKMSLFMNLSCYMLFIIEVGHKQC